MNLSELINEILSEWAYRCDDGMPNPKNPIHLKELSDVLSEMGLSHIKNTLVENLLMEKGKTPERVKEAEGSFSNPILNKKIKYKNAKGEDAEGIVGNLLRLPAEHPGRKAAEALLPADGTPDRDKMNQDLGGQGQAGGAEKPKDDKGGEEPAAGGGGEEEKAKAAQAMFDPKADPAMAARMDTEKEVQAQLAKDAEADKEVEKEQEPKEDNEFNPIDSKDVSAEMPQADPETFGGGSDIPDGVTPEELDKFNTDISKVAQQIADAKAKGEPAPNINLCDVTVPGTNLYCDDNLGIPRDEMPQFKGTAQPGSRAAGMEADASGEVDTEPVFKEMLKEKGIKTLQTEIPADKLKATQKDLVGAKVIGMMGALEKDPTHPKITAPIYVSRDGHVIDGHHRWAAIVAYNAAHPDAQIPMKTTVLDMDIKDAIPMANKFAEDMGIAAKKADANKEGPSEQPNAAKEKTKEETTKVANDLKGRTTSEGEELDVDTTDNGSLIIGVEHGADKESNKQAIEQIKKLPKDTKVMFVGEGGSKDDDGNIEFGGEQDEFRNAVNDHFTNAEESTWDENADVLNDKSPVFDEVAKSVGGSKSKAKAALWSNMYGQDGPDENMLPEDYLDDEGKAWLIDQAKKGGSSEFDGEVDWNSLTDAQQKDLYELNYRDDDGYGETEISKAQEAYNGFRQKELDRKIKEAEDNGYTVIAPVGNSHVDMRRQRTKKAGATPTSSASSTPSTPTSAPKLTDKVKQKISNWTEKEKAFFDRNEGAPGSKERRSLGEALKAKAAGALKAIKKGAKHEVEEFKEAGKGVQNFFSGKPLSEKEEKALKAVAFKVVTTAVFGAAFGGLSHGVAAFGKHVAMEFIPHIIGETILKGVGKAAVFADAEGEAETDANVLKFTEMIAKGLEEMEITPEMMEQMVDSYNEKKENGEIEDESSDVKTEHLHLVDELMLEMIYGFIAEIKSEGKGGESKEYPGYFHIGGGYYSKKPDGEISHKSVDGSMKALSSKEKAEKNKKATNEPVAGASMFDKDYAKDRGTSTPTSKKKKQPTVSNDEPVVSDNGPVVTKQISADEDPPTEKGAKEINSKKFNSKQFTQSEITQEQAFINVETAFPKIKKHDYQYPNGSDAYLKNVMHPAAFEAMDTLIKLSKGGDFVPPISMITNQYGAGKISAQMNELCMQAVMAFPNTNEGIANRNAFIESLRENNKTITKSGQKPILDDTWIDEFAGASDAFNGALDRQYGKGNWKAVGTTWDVRSQNEDRGINYDDKGFSTDINIQIESNGKKENVEISCKKDWKIFLLNAGLGDASNWYYTLGPEKEKRATDLMQKAAAKIKLSKEEVSELKELSKQALAKAPVSNKSLQADQYKSAQKGAQVIDAIEPKELNRIYKQWIAGDYEGGVDKKGKVKSVNDPDFTKAAIAAHMKAGIGNEEVFHKEMRKLIPDYKATDKYYKKAVVCINNMLAQTKTDDDAMAWHTSHMGITKKFVENAAQTLVRDKEYRKMLLRKLQESIPIKTLTEGVETMQIDSMYITKEHMGSLFGTNDWKDIRQYLDVQVINGEGILTYKAKGKTTTKPISIAKIGIREKGTGYDGNPALEVKPSVQFEAEMRRITKELENK